MNTTRATRLSLIVLLTLVAACDGGSGGGNGPAGGGGGGAAPTPAVATVSVTPDTWNATRIGQRQQLTATAMDASGNPIPGKEMTWESSNPNVADVDSNGLVTARSAGAALVTATSESQSAMSSLKVRSAIPSAVGDMYTLWPARSDDSPALLVNGTLRFAQDIYCREEDNWKKIIVCPTPLPGGPPGKIPGPTSPWQQGGISKFQWSGDRIGILSDMSAGHGTFRAVDRHEEWTVLAIGNASAFQLERNRIGLVVDDGRFLVKEGIHGPWTELEASGVIKFQLAGNRIAVLRDGGFFRVKDGIHGAWTILAHSGVRDFQLEGNRIAILSDDGLFRVKDGISGPWTTLEANGLRKFQLEGNRIAVWRDDGIFRVKDGIHGAWTILASGGVRDFQLEGNRIGLWHDDGVFRVKDGIHGAWTILADDGLSAFQLQEDFIGILTNEGVLRVKKSIHGGWRETGKFGTGVTQFRLAVDVPSPPVRTTPDTSVSTAEVKSYANGQEACNKNQPVNCQTPIASAFPADWYGRFCGKNNPSDAEFWIAMGAGPIDSLDYICQHHDRAAGWYPDETVTFTQACIVRYGLFHGRLTRNGKLLTAGTAVWNAVWNRMPVFRDAVASYTNNEASYCSDDDLPEFTANTAAQHN